MAHSQLGRSSVRAIATSITRGMRRGEVLLDALAAEHGMRLMAAESALEWLDNTATVTSRR